MIQRSGRGRRLGIDEILKCFFLVPYYKTRRGEIKPTVVKRWVDESTAELDMSNAKVYKIK